MLSKEQSQIIETEHSNVLVVACPGAGKTRCLMERIKFLLNSGVNPEDIVAITFTNFAAQEMLSRIENKDDRMFIGTIHSYANLLLLKNGFDTSRILSEERFDELLEEGKKVKNKPTPKYLFIDEFQDLCQNEYDFIQSIKYQNFMAFSDDDQAIYGFKGGDIQLFFNLLEDDNVHKYYLTQNYRCGEKIVDFAKEFLYDLKKRSNKTIKHKEGIASSVIYDDYKSAISVLNDSFEDDYKDWFILARTNAELDIVIDYLIRKSIPYDTFKKSEYTYEEVLQLLEKNSVKVLTIHAAKGLENKNVIVIGGNEWNDGERRVCYVAATRAKNKLYWCNKIVKNKKKTYQKNSNTSNVKLITF